jgi:hypothetical protein
MLVEGSYCAGLGVPSKYTSMCIASILGDQDAQREYAWTT